jgi:hypothetical protein
MTRYRHFNKNKNIDGRWCIWFYLFIFYSICTCTGSDPGFQVRGAHLKKLRRAEGSANIFEVFRVKNHDFTPIFFIFFNIKGWGAPGAPPPTPGSAPNVYQLFYTKEYVFFLRLFSLRKPIYKMCSHDNM